jgi:hypothetical protein
MKMNRKIVTLASFTLAGVLLAFAVVPLVGRAAAIAWPPAYAEWVRASDFPELWLLLWSVAVDGLIGFGIAFAVVGLIALKFSVSSRWATLSVLALGFLSGVYFLVPAYFGQLTLVTSALAGRSWWGYGFEIAMVLSVVATALLHSQLMRRRTGR